MTIHPTPTPNSIDALAVAELNSMHCADSAEDAFIALVEVDEDDTTPTVLAMNAVSNAAMGIRMDTGMTLPPQYDAGNWPLYSHERRGSIPMGITV